MARSHRMTAARRAALRKAQLASARKRRKHGVRSGVKRSISQGRSSAKASASLARRSKNYRRHVAKKAVKGAAIAAVAGGVVAGGVGYARSDRGYVHRKGAKATYKGYRKTGSYRAGREAARRQRPLHKANAKRRKKSRRR